MIDSLLLDNFKAFGRPTGIELAPITLLFGENSAGKSSVLQSLNLLKQTQQVRDAGVALLPRAEDAISDLGSFRELVFDHDCRRLLTLGVGQRTRRHSRRVLPYPGGGEPSWIGLSQTFSQPDAAVDIDLERMALWTDGFARPFATFKVRFASREETRELLRRPYFFPGRGRRPAGTRSRVRVAECDQVVDDAGVWEPIFREWKAGAATVVEALRTMRNSRSHGGQGEFEFDGEGSDPRTSLESFDSAITFYESAFEFGAFVERMLIGLRSQRVLLTGQGFVPERPSFGAPLPEFMLSRLMREGVAPGVRRLPFPDIAIALAEVAYETELALSALFPMGPYRRPPERWYIFTGTSPEDVGYKGQLLPDLLFRRAELVERANDWLKRLDVGYQLRVAPVGKDASDLFEVRLLDTRRGSPVEVALSDVGFGVSQILPFLVQSLAAEGQIISIEQPEVHIHPRLQADLGDLLAETIKEPYGHQFLVETHSEHLMLRLQRLVREGRLKNTDVSVIYVSRGGEGSAATRLQLDEDGDFIEEWPGGFFPERRREL